MGLHTVPLPSLLYWLSRPKGSNLVEAHIPAKNTGVTSACRSMAIAVSKEMLYKDRCPLVGVGLMYTLPYLPRVAFSAAYMNLSEWRDAPEASENRLVGTRLMFIHASEASAFLPVAEKHPVLLDVASTEILGNIESSVSPFSLRGFQLHTIFSLLPDGNRVRQVIFPCLQGGETLTLMPYEKETISPELGPQQPMGIDLCAPSPEHWNIALDTMLPMTMENYR